MILEGECKRGEEIVEVSKFLEGLGLKGIHGPSERLGLRLQPNEEWVEVEILEKVGLTDPVEKSAAV